MSRSFRYAPPEPRPEALVRPRLLRELLRRWEHRVTVVVGGPGFGKTTLLAQALAENRLTPRGEDVWVGLSPGDADAETLATTVARAIGADGGEPTAAAAQLVWQRSPRQLCVVLDDVHLLPGGSSGAAWLARFIDDLPDNGHVLLSSRREPAIALARLDGLGAVRRLEEDRLRLSSDERRLFAEQRGLRPDQLEASGGWPAMAELAATARRGRTDAYLWEEVLRPLGDARRRVLAVVCDLGGADNALASAATGDRVDLAAALAGIPLVAESRDGWFVPHALWRTVPALGLEAGERVALRRRAVEHMTGRGSFEDAFALIDESELWDLAPPVLRAACLSSERLNPGCSNAAWRHVQRRCGPRPRARWRARCGWRSPGRPRRSSHCAPPPKRAAPPATSRPS